MSDLHPIDPNGGFYTASEAARLLGLVGAQGFLRWFDATPKGGDPIIVRQYPKAGVEHEIGFLDLLEIRFIEHFRQQKLISLQSLRVAARNARAVLHVDHPFATSNVKFQSDRRQVFLETARETDDRSLLNLMNNQWEMYEIVEQFLAKDLEFDVSGLARLWRPRPGEFPNVVVSPAFAFGQPVVSDRVPTSAIYRTWRAESGDFDAAAEWFGVERAEAEEAVFFEMSLAH